MWVLLAADRRELAACDVYVPLRAAISYARALLHPVPRRTPGRSPATLSGRRHHTRQWHGHGDTRVTCLPPEPYADAVTGPRGEVRSALTLDFERGPVRNVIPWQTRKAQAGPESCDARCTNRSCTDSRPSS